MDRMNRNFNSGTGALKKWAVIVKLYLDKRLDSKVMS